jgi:hypothetical protein
LSVVRVEELEFLDDPGKFGCSIMVILLTFAAVYAPARAGDVHDVGTPALT